MEILGHQVANEEGGGQRGILDDHDEFIAQGRKNVLDRLRHDNEPHSAPFAKAEAKRRFPLTGIDRLNAGTNNLLPIEPLVITGIIYFIMTFALSKLFGHFEHKMQRSDRQSGTARQRKSKREGAVA